MAEAAAASQEAAPAIAPSDVSVEACWCSPLDRASLTMQAPPRKVSIGEEKVVVGEEKVVVDASDQTKIVNEASGSSAGQPSVPGCASTSNASARSTSSARRRLLDRATRRLSAISPVRTCQRRRLPAQAASIEDRANFNKSLEDVSAISQAVDVHLWRDFRLLPPASDSLYKTNWELLMYLFVAYNCLTIPFQIAFLGSAKTDLNLELQIVKILNAIDAVIDTHFWIDMVITFRTAFYDRDGVLVTDQRVIASKYFSSWFPLDFCATFPWETLASGVGWVSFLKAFRLVRISRLLKRLEHINSIRMVRIAAATPHAPRTQGSWPGALHLPAPLPPPPPPVH